MCVFWASYSVFTKEKKKTKKNAVHIPFSSGVLPGHCKHNKRGNVLDCSQGILDSWHLNFIYKENERNICTEISHMYLILPFSFRLKKN